VGHRRSQASRGCGRSLLPVEVGVYVVIEAGAGVAILVNVVERKGYNPAPCTFRVSCAA
jgi:hypothetical protein